MKGERFGAPFSIFLTAGEPGRIMKPGRRAPGRGGCARGGLLMAADKITSGAGTRYALPDALRGLTLISMIVYHGCWDMVYILGVDWPWYQSTGAYL